MQKQRLGLFGRLLCATSLGFLACFSSVSGAWEHGSKRVITVMTQNMDAGTDLGYLFTVPDLVTAATLTYGEVLQSDIPRRAARLAAIIARQQPDLISLQEVTLWQTVLSDGKTITLYDQLDLLLKALTALNQRYRVVVSQDLTESALPVDPALIGRPDDPVRALGFKDRDAILARSEPKKSELALSNIQKRLFCENSANCLAISLGGQPLQVLRGWMSVDGKIRGKKFRFANTHLESVNPFIPGTAAIQVAQAEELIDAMNTTDLPVILAGDFNADAELAGLGPDQTETPLKILDAGYTDAWHARHPQRHGFTWPLFLEDPSRPNPSGPFERIDLVYGRDVGVLAVQRVGTLLRQFASDHAGVVAKLQVAQ